MNPDHRNDSVSTRETTIEQIDARSSRLLEAEIENLRREGIETRVAPSDDEAYDNHDKIAQVYHWLEGIDDRIDAARNAKSGRYAPFGVGAVAKKLARRGLKPQLDAIRADYLYNVVEAVPWWRQGGSALALGTIVDAFRMTSHGAGSGYARVSGRITESILTHRFDETVPELQGMSLETAAAHMYRYFGLKGILLRRPSRAVREREAADKMAHLDAFVHARNTESFLDIVRYCQGN